ncbi:hypothetical protein DXG01_005400 [Tephrocybe rancida]|nr:hypothetical protein DXG01_005400 [Tephrocybe rancida]
MPSQSVQALQQLEAAISSIHLRASDDLSQFKEMVHKTRPSLDLRIRCASQSGLPPYFHQSFVGDNGHQERYKTAESPYPRINKNDRSDHRIRRCSGTIGHLIIYGNFNLQSFYKNIISIFEKRPQDPLVVELLHWWNERVPGLIPTNKRKRGGKHKDGANDSSDDEAAKEMLGLLREGGAPKGSSSPDTSNEESREETRGQDSELPAPRSSPPCQAAPQSGSRSRQPASTSQPPGPRSRSPLPCQTTPTSRTRSQQSASTSQQLATRFRSPLPRQAIPQSETASNNSQRGRAVENLLADPSQLLPSLDATAAPWTISDRSRLRSPTAKASHSRPFHVVKSDLHAFEN